ncbi:hypothetical protein DM784_17640 [Vibrio furnissii]|nr:hypothetical protein DM784_17640 [Vibrio furnissii]
MHVPLIRFIKAKLIVMSDALLRLSVALISIVVLHQALKVLPPCGQMFLRVLQVLSLIHKGNVTHQLVKIEKLKTRPVLVPFLTMGKRLQLHVIIVM